MFDWSEFFNAEHSLAQALFEQAPDPAWLLGELSAFCQGLMSKLGQEYKLLQDAVYVHETATIHESAYIAGPAIIGPAVDIRYAVYLRGSVILDEGVTLANSTEVKNAVLLRGATCPHYNYVGDSLLGPKAHLGAGVILSNLRSDRQNIVIDYRGEQWATGRHKFGAVIGEACEIGCQSVLNPGTLLGKGSQVYPLTSLRGYFPANSKVGHRPISC